MKTTDNKKRKEKAIVTQVTDYQTKYDFSSFRLLKRLRMALAIILEGGFFVIGKTKNKTIVFEERKNK